MKNKTTKVRQTRADSWFDGVNIFLLCIVLVIFIYPLLFVVSASFSSPSAVWGGKVWLFPVEFNIHGYMEAFKDNEIWIGYKNSIIYTFVGVIINLFVTVTCAYPLSQRNFKARRPLSMFYTFTMFFSGGLIPTYLLVKNLHLLDTMWGVLLPQFATVTNIIITRTFFENNIPQALQEAAFLDGCTNFSYLKKIVIPLSKPILAVMALYYGVNHWNNYFQPMIYLNSQEKFTLQQVLRDKVLEASMLFDMTSGADAAAAAQKIQAAESMKYCVIILATIPTLMIYPFVQKYFVKGVMIGSVKG